MLPDKDLKEFLDTKTDLYNRPSFIPGDPVSIPHLFSKKEDVEISGFLAATIAWGQRTTIIKNARGLMERMDMQPFDFVMSAQKKELARLDNFVHRTFNGIGTAGWKTYSAQARSRAI
ncbi:MAG: hypothetical protein FD123_2322 [Bacteroidetes bacterium]|nr:MAG: hypothetical protein FD123_2322 [Bacteroidota bacterium]